MLLRTAPALSLAATLAAALLPGGLAAQVSTVDEGSFSITRGGAPAGREEFSIRSTPGIGGATILKAQATVSLDGRRIVPALSTDGAGNPASYQLEVRADGQVVERLSGQISRGRMSVRAQSATGASAREYVVPAGAVIIDDEVFHQYHFVAQHAAGGGSVPMVNPRRGAQGVLRVTAEGGDRVTVAGQSVAATRLEVSGGGAERRVWVDASGRVLRVEIPSAKLVAVRDELPR